MIRAKTYFIGKFGKLGVISTGAGAPESKDLVRKRYSVQKSIGCQVNPV